MIFLRTNLYKFVEFKQYKGKSGPRGANVGGTLALYVIYLLIY